MPEGLEPGSCSSKAKGTGVWAGLREVCRLYRTNRVCSCSHLQIQRCGDRSFRGSQLRSAVCSSHVALCPPQGAALLRYQRCICLEITVISCVADSVGSLYLQLSDFTLLQPLVVLNKMLLRHWRLHEPFKGGVGSYLLFVMVR